jgi:chaperonin cofactor prefoldin
MKSLQDYLDQMDHLLGELVQVATQLRDLSLKVISEEELAPLQKHQEELLSQIESVDEKIRANYPHQIKADLQEKIHHQLESFQKLNREYIQNLDKSHGIIQFDLRRIKSDEEGDFSRLSRLNKMLPSPSRSKAVKTKKSKEA